MHNMAHITLSVITLLHLFISKVTSVDEGYYWREYNGTISSDAVIGGKDGNGKNIYIGQAYTREVGLMPVEIFPGVKRVFVPIDGKVIRIDNYVKVLCGHKDNFYWLSANYKDLHTTLIDKNAVVGGHVDDDGPINIGRISRSGEIKIGRILSYDIGRAYFFFNDNGSEGQDVEYYEILIYKSGGTTVKNKITETTLDPLIASIFAGL